MALRKMKVKTTADLLSRLPYRRLVLELLPDFIIYAGFYVHSGGGA